MEGNNALQVFNYEGQQVRTVEKDGETWFVAKDVCDILEIQNHKDAIKSLDDDEKSGVDITDPHGRVQVTNVITESGVYALVFRSRKPEAKKFSRWVRREVLPEIRKTGAYVPDKALMDPAGKKENSTRHPQIFSLHGINKADHKRIKARL